MKTRDVKWVVQVTQPVNYRAGSETPHEKLFAGPHLKHALPKKLTDCVSSPSVFGEWGGWMFNFLFSCNSSAHVHQLCCPLILYFKCLLIDDSYYFYFIVNIYKSDLKFSIKWVGNVYIILKIIQIAFR